MPKSYTLKPNPPGEGIQREGFRRALGLKGGGRCGFSSKGLASFLWSPTPEDTEDTKAVRKWALHTYWLYRAQTLDLLHMLR